MTIQLHSKNALVGAATQGIGAGIAIQLAKCGANVTVMARNEDKLKDFVSSLPIVSEEQKHRYLVADFSDFGSFRNIIADYFRNHHIDILVNNTNGPKTRISFAKEYGRLSVGV
ncbi:SDR family NAD(P)-dependent oxidoreductase [uncultured Chryseobacterium sp.]|uniref:SDR family NAD(P)-dependent oxidoreductase n=1 Tax=uncultured Chryseobacterium sp. TaxID=259322 RepID=UPI0034132580